MIEPQIAAAAAVLGREGGKKKVPKGFSKMKKSKLKAASRAGIIARWGCKKCQCHPCTCREQNQERRQSE